MKKKVFSLLAVVLFAGSLMSVSPNKELVEDGRASDCARMARSTVLTLADEFGVDANGVYFDYFINLYHKLYEGCL